MGERTMTLDNNVVAFRSWLTLNRGIDAASADSYVDYCTRIERDLPTSLGKYLITEAGLQSVLVQIEMAIPNEKSQNNLKTAAKAYAEFLQSARSAR